MLSKSSAAYLLYMGKSYMFYIFQQIETVNCALKEYALLRLKLYD